MEGVAVVELTSTRQGDVRTTTKTSCARLVCAAKRDVMSPAPVVDDEELDHDHGWPAWAPVPAVRDQRPQGRGRTDATVWRWAFVCMR